MKPVVCDFFHKLCLLLSLPFCVSAHEFSAKISYLQPCHSCPCPFKILWQHSSKADGEAEETRGDSGAMASAKGNWR